MKKVLNIAHRGYTRNYPENTLEAFRAAIDLGVDGIEFDVQETTDGAFFIFHDDTMDGRPIIEMRSDDMKKRRIKSRYKIPALEQVLQICSQNTALIIELKQVRALDKFLAMLKAHADPERVALISFDRDLIARLAVLAPDIKRAVITGSPVAHPAEITGPTGSTAIGIRCEDLRPELTAQLHEAGTMAFVWGCPDAESVRKALAFDIDGIISDYPDVVKEASRRED